MSDNPTPSQGQAVNQPQEPTDFAEQSGDKSSVANSEIVPTSPRQVDVSSPRINSSLAARDDDASAAISPDANGWMPIETAPRDGTAVLLFFPNRYQGTGGISWACFISGDWLDSRAIRDNDATHWQPLPKPPVSEAAQ